MSLKQDYKCEQCKEKVGVLYFDKNRKDWYCKKCTEYFNKRDLSTFGIKTSSRAIFDANRAI